MLNYFGDGTRSDADEAMLKDIPVIAKGQPMQGRFFPVVFDPEWLQTKSRPAAAAGRRRKQP